MPSAVSARYPWIPTGYEALVRETRAVVGPDEKAWLLTVCDYSEVTESAHAWNEWERQSLDAAHDDAAWSARIRAFWDSHFPILLSVKSGNAYFAIERSRHRVVCGEEPEYEETSVIAATVEELLLRVVERDPALARWI
ncbi:MAG: hypothetical protein U0174_25000 [Polyangiaceae bacterium]